MEGKTLSKPKFVASDHLLIGSYILLGQQSKFWLFP